ncbi:MAG: hypothetical protein ACRELF_03475 [Gemmataceae bacterium]
MPECDRGRKHRLTAQTRACLLWGLAFFAAAQTAMLIATQSYWPHLRDPEFGYKLSLLRTRRAEEPDRPLLVLLGSSRTGQGIRPGVLKDMRTADGRSPLVFNFSQVGSGALAELVTLRRLLDAGIRPDWLAIEILPALLGRTIDACGDVGGGVSRVSWNDLQLLCRYVPDPDRLRHRWIKVQLWPWHAHRFSFMNHYLSNCVPWRLRMDHWKSLDRWGWSDIGLDTQPLVLVPDALELARMTYQWELRNLHIAPMQDRALRDLLALCRQEGIPTVLYLMPEGSIYRGWYAEPTRVCLDDYLTRLSREYGMPIVNARTWMPDKYFGDSHHLYRRGAILFSRRFGSRVLSRLVQGKPESMPSLLAPLSPAYPRGEQHRQAEMQVHKPSPPSTPILSIDGGNAPAPR